MELFCLPQLQSKEREHYIWDFEVPVRKLVKVIVLHVRKGAKFGTEKVNSSQNICSRDASVGNEKDFEKQGSVIIGLRDY